MKRFSSPLTLALAGLLLALGVGTAPALAATGDLVVVAGTGSFGKAGDGGPALDATFGNMSDTAVDAQGNLFIVDTQFHMVRRVDVQTGLISRVAGTGLAGFSGDGGSALSARLNYPYGIAVDADGNLFIADSYNRRIRRVDALTGVITTVAGDGTAAVFKLPIEVEVGTNGNLLVADFFGHVVVSVDLNTGLHTVVAGNGAGGYSGDGVAATATKLAYPRDVAVDVDGNLFIADSYNKRVRRVDAATGQIETVVLLAVDRVESIVVDGGGNLFVSTVPASTISTFNQYTILRVDPFGVQDTLLVAGNAAGLGVGEDTHLYLAGGLARQLFLIEGVTVPLSAGLAANQPPVADAGPDRMVECLADLVSPVTLDGSGSWDPDGDALNYIWNWGTGASGDVSPTTNLPLGMNLVELTVDDGISGSSTDQAVITVIDTTPPRLALGPGLLFEADHAEGVYFDLASSGLMGDVREACGLEGVHIAPGSPYPLGVTPVTVTASDLGGNVAREVMNITVRDTTPPLLTVPDDLVDVPATGPLTVVELGSATATDLFGPVTITNDAPKDGFPLGLTTVTWVATDTNGNKVSDTQNVMVSYLWGGFLRPLGGSENDFNVGNPGHNLVFKAGRTIPVRFRLLFADGTPVPGAVARLEVAPLNGAPAVVVDRVERDPFLFRYDADDGVYRLNLRTHRSMVGNYLLTVVLEDGTGQEVEITLR